jgi:hypothetical protein
MEQHHNPPPSTDWSLTRPVLISAVNKHASTGGGVKDLQQPQWCDSVLLALVIHEGA